MSRDFLRRVKRALFLLKVVRPLLIDLERTSVTRKVIGIGLPHATKRFEIVSHFFISNVFFLFETSSQLCVCAKNNRHSSNKHAGVQGE